MKKLRLLLFEQCNRNCQNCCNKYFDLDALPYAESFAGYDEILLTGGEPMLHPKVIKQALTQIKQQHTARVFLYTAKVDETSTAVSILKLLDGMTVTLHEQEDLAPWVAFNTAIPKYLKKRKSLRLNVFTEVDISDADTTGWNVWDNKEWDIDCPLPAGEVFKVFKR